MYTSIHYDLSNILVIHYIIYYYYVGITFEVALFEDIFAWNIPE